MGHISLRFASSKEANEIAAFAKTRRTVKRKNEFEFDGGMSGIEKMFENQFISKADFDHACSHFERGARIESVFLKCKN